MSSYSRIYEETMKNNLTQINDEKVRRNYEKMRIYNDNSMYKELIIEEVFPYKIDIEPTSRCFLQCSYCQVPYWDRKKLPDLTYEKFKEILDRLPYVLEIKLQGQGEPLLNKDFFLMVKYAVEKNIMVRTYTNGMLMDKSKCEQIIKSGLFEIRISIDAATQETTDIMRKGMNLDIVKENIKTLLKMRGDNKLPRVNVWSLLCKKNIHEMEMIIDMCEKLGVDGLFFQSKLSVHGNEITEKKAKHDTIDIGDTEIIELLNEINNRMKDKTMDFEIQTSKWRSIENPCWWINNSTFISSDGYILPCCMICYPERMNFGNIFQNSFEDIWLGYQYRKFRLGILEGKIPDICKWCYGED